MDPVADAADSNAEGTDGGNEMASSPPWASATAADLQDLDFEAPIVGSPSTSAGELSERFAAAARDSSVGAPAARVFTMLASVTGMHFKPEDRDEPFCAMMSFADGRRTAIPSDFRGAPLDVLAQIARCAENPVLRARLADTCWLLDRKTADLGGCAIAAYSEVVRKIDCRELKVPFDEQGGALAHDVVEYLRRALQIGRAIGWDKPETIAARELTALLLKRATELRALVPVMWFGQLDLDFRVSDPAEVAADIDQALAMPPQDANGLVVVELWRLGARAYHFAKKDADKYRCLSQAAEHLVSDAEASLAKGAALLASHQLSTAIAQLHGVPGKKDRRTELRHKLIDVQARTPDEMSGFSQELDLRPFAEAAERALSGRDLTEMLFAFASIVVSPRPEKLLEDAVKLMRNYPLSSLMPVAHLDSEGKVIHRSAGNGADESAVQRQIAQSERLRRQFAAQGTLEAARRMIMSNFFLSDDVLAFLLQHSPFVPPNYVATFSRGFLRFFQGDYASAAYILTPLLENSLRYVLRAHGHD